MPDNDGIESVYESIILDILADGGDVEAMRVISTRRILSEELGE